MSERQITAEAAICRHDEDAIQVGWELPDSALGYLLIALPLENGSPDDAWFGHSHYVEVQDQVHGEYGGLDRLALVDDHEVALRFRNRLAGVAGALTIRTAAPMSSVVLAQLRRAERLIGGDGD